MPSQLCVVLRSVNYQDNDKILTLFSRESGKIHARARGARRVKSGITTASQLMCCAEYEFYEKKDRLYVTNALVKDEFYHIQNNYTDYIAACIMLELTEKVLEHEQQNEQLFIVLVNTLYALNRQMLGSDAALAYYCVRVVELLGILPALDFCVHCGDAVPQIQYWNAYEGGAVCVRCREKDSRAVRALPQLGDVFSVCLQTRPQGLAGLQLGVPDATPYVRLLMAYVQAAADIRLRAVGFYTGVP